MIILSKMLFMESRSPYIDKMDVNKENTFVKYLSAMNILFNDHFIYDYKNMISLLSTLDLMLQ